jgi:hypothetical protein
VIGYRHRQICIRFDQQVRWPVKTGFTVTVDMSALRTPLENLPNPNSYFLGMQLLI